MDRLRAEYFTDPLCSWSWSNEPHYRKLREEFDEQIQWRHRLGGLMAQWSSDFYDPLYDLRGGDAEALAKHQDEVSLENQMPIDVGFWFECPPYSTFQICIAVKAAGLQSADLEDRYLRRAREALLTEKRCLNRSEALVSLAEEIPGIDLKRFSTDLEGKAAKNAFREDWEMARRPVPKAKDTKVTEGHLRYSFPTLLLYNPKGEYRVLDGGHPYEAYLHAIQELDPTIKRRRPPDIETFVRKYQRVTTKEVSVVCMVPWEQAEAALKRMVEASWLRRRPVGHFYIYDVVEAI